MIQTFELLKPEALPQERFFALVQQARRIAIEIEGVYDLALYQDDKDKRWYWSVDVEDEHVWGRLQGDARFLKVIRRLQSLGVSVLPKARLDRHI